MYLKAVKWKDGTWLAPGSKAYELYHDKSDKGHKLLEKHLKELDNKEKKIQT